MIYQYLQRKAHEDPNIIRLSDNVEVIDAEVSFKIAGHIEERLVSEGEVVKRGQTVARLDSKEPAQEVALRKAEVRAAQAVLAELEAGSRPEKIAQTETVLERAKAEASRWQLEYGWKKKLFAEHVIPPSDHDVDRMDDEAARAKVRKARDRAEQP
jgi:HlyD family secretion protein